MPSAVSRSPRLLSPERLVLLEWRDLGICRCAALHIFRMLCDFTLSQIDTPPIHICMRSLLATLTRLMPLMFLVIVIISMVQFLSQHPIHGSGVAHLIHRVGATLVAGWFYVAAAAVFLWVLVWLGLRHERRRRLTPATAESGSWSMDILDRLTNREALEAGLLDAAEPTFVDAESLARELKAKVVGQDQVCEVSWI